jgi:parallel beta-helix repeat protein
MRTKLTATIALTMLLIAFIMPFTLNQVNASTTYNYIIKPDGKVYEGLTEVHGVFEVSDSTYTLLGSFSGSLMTQKGDIVIDGAGFTLTGPGAGSGYGIRIDSVNNVTVTNFNVNSAGSLIELVNSEYSNINACNLTNGVGAWLDNSNHTVITRNTIANPSSSDSGMIIRNSGYNNITENTVSYASNGISIDTTLSNDESADYNIVSNNTVSHCSNAGIAIQNLASFNNVTNNNLTDCNNAIYLQGSYNMIPYYPYNNTVLNNKATDSSYGVNVGSAPYTTITGNLIETMETYGICISDSFSGEEQSCIAITDNLLFNCSWGMFVMTSNTTITDNFVMGSETSWGIYMQSNNNTVVGNVFQSSTNHAIMVAECLDNIIYHNDFLQNNANNALYSSGANTWDNGYPSGGNYWSAAKLAVDEYTGVDQDVPGHDNIIDTPLTLGADNVDHYPLVYPYVLRMLNVSFVGNGTVGDGITLHYPGEQVSVGATPDEGYDLVHWLLDGQQTAGNPLLVNMTSNHNLTAVFKAPHILGNWTYAGESLNAGTSIIQTSDGGYVIAGYSGSYKETTDYDFWLAKISSTGVMQWNHTYGSDAYDYAYSLIQNQEGGYVIVGGTPEGAGGFDVWILKTDAAGNQVWNKTYGYGRNDEAHGILPVQGGGYIVAGYTTDSDFSSDMWLMKIDNSGNQVWNKTYGVDLSDEVCYGIVNAPGGGYVLAGYTSLWSGETGQDVWIVKVDADGNQLWNQTYSSPTYEEARSIVVTQDNGYAVAGFGGSWGEHYALLMKVDEDGVQEWNQTYSYTGDTEVFSIVNAQDSGYVLTGYTQPESEKQALLMKTYANGTEQWKRTCGTEEKDDIANCVIRTEEGGYAFTGSEGSDCMLYVVDSNGYITEPQTYYLTVNKNGQGTVTPNSQGYEDGTVVALEATPANGWSFSGWSGDVQGSTTTKTITMNGNKTVTATFTQIVLPPPPPTYSVIFTQTGLADGASWTVTLDGTSKTASTSTISFDGYQDGSYQYTITLPSGYITSHALSGAVTVNGQDVTQTVAFVKLQAVVFTALDLPAGAQWTVTLNGETQTSNGTITFELPSGTYNYTISLPTGYISSASLTGTLTVSGTTQPVTIPTAPESAPTPTPTTTPTDTPTQTPRPTITPTPTPQANSNLTITQPTGGQTATATSTSTNGTQQVTVTATPDQGYTFAYWLLDGQRIESGNTLTLPANEQHSLQAIFQATAQMTPTQTPQLNSFTVPVAAAVSIIIIVLLLMLVQRRRKKENKPN